MAPTSWYYVDGGQQQGPVDVEELGRMLRAGRLTRETLVWGEGLGDWQAAGAVPGLATYLAPSAPPAPRPRPAPPTRPAAAAIPASRPSRGAGFARPALITLLAVLNLLGAVFMLIAAVFGLVGAVSGTERLPGIVMAVCFGLLGALYLAAGIGLWQLKGFGRRIQIAFAIIGLLGIPIGTLISALLLYYLTRPGIKLLFSGRSAAELDESERAEVEKVSGGGVVLVVVIVVILGLVVVGVGIIAAVAIPSLLRARVAANEASALGDLRSVISAQAVYASSSGGVYGSPACLAAPSSCLSDYPAGMPLLDASLVIEGTKGGYVRTFHSGPPMSSATGVEGLSSFAVTLVPAEPGQTGVRSFCGDASGLICQDPTGAPFDAEAGACPAGCIPVG